jgi:glycosyltransferase involved in cell wall biosynthesis/SAM-dependent methyltransferase
MQETTFPVQVLIHDDASTDNTTAILKEYEARYPDLIRVFYQPRNTYKDPNKSELRSEYVSWIYKGKYIAFCEGDDHWTDPSKLQRQVECLETHADCAGCFHNGQVYFEAERRSQKYLGRGGKPGGEYFRELPADRIYTEQLISLTTFVPTASLLYRASSHPAKYYDYDWRVKSASDDICTFSMLTKDQQYLKYLDFDGLVYRKHSGGVSLTHNSWFQYINRSQSYKHLSEFHNNKYEKEYQNLIRLHRIYGFRWLLANWFTLNQAQIQELVEELKVSPSTPIATLRIVLENELKIELSKEMAQPSYDFEPFALQQPSAVRAISPFFSGTFLDVGYGIMPYKKMLTGKGSWIERYIGLDIETEIYSADVDLRWDGQTIPLEDASVDSAMATEVLEHCPDPLVVLKEIRRVLKPGGAFFFTVPYIWPLHDAPWDFYRYTPFSLKKLLAEAGFEDLEIRALSGWDASLAQMMGLWLKRAPMEQQRRNEMAQKLWPIYQDLLQTDELPKNPEAGNTMATGWSGLVYAGAKAEVVVQPEIEPIDLPIVIVRSHASNYSETFIEDHVKHISSQTTLLYGWPFPRFVSGDHSVLAAALESQLSQAIRSRQPVGQELQLAYVQGVATYLKSSGAKAVLLESGLMGAMLGMACEQAQLPYAVHFHGVDAFQYDILEQWRSHYQRFFKTAAAVVGVSQEMVGQLQELGAEPSRLVHAPYGVSVELEALAQPQNAAPIFLSVGRFVDKKAPQKTLQAFEAVYRKVPESRLIMVGEGPLLRACQQWAEAQGIGSAVTFSGVQSRRSVSRLMSISRVFVQHSICAESGDREGLPLAILEAGAHGLPVVATRHAGIPDAIREGRDGFLVDEGDIKAMAVAMYQLAQDAELAGRMGQTYQARVRTDYSRAVSIARLQELLQRIVAAPLVTDEPQGRSGHAQQSSVAAPLTLAEIAVQIESTEHLQQAMQLGQQSAQLEDQGLAFQCYERAVALDRGCGRAYLEMGIRLGQAGQYEDAYLCLKEAERAGALTESSSGLLRGLEANPELDSSEIKLYRARTEVASPVASEQPRRILVFTNILPPQEMGGYGRSIWELCEGLILRGHTVRILTADMPDLAQAPYPNYERVEQYVTRNLKLFGDWQHGGARTMEDVGGIQEIVRHNARSIFQEIQDFQPDLCMAGNLDFLGAAMLAPILAQKIPIVHRLGNGAPGFIPADTPKSELYCIAGCSNWVNQELVRNGYQPSHFALLPPGSPLHEYYRFVVPRFDRLRICFAGLMMAYKGPHLIVEALGLLKKLGLVFTCEFAGNFKDPVYERQFKHLLMKHGVSKEVRLHGFCGRQQLADMFDRSNVLVMPSVFEEPFGKVQIEAQAAGLAVVRSPVGGYKDMLQDEVNGLLFKREDAQDLARQLFVLQGDVGLWQRLARQGQRDAFEYTTQRSVETLEGIFERLIARST